MGIFSEQSLFQYFKILSFHNKKIGNWPSSPRTAIVGVEPEDGEWILKTLFLPFPSPYLP